MISKDWDRFWTEIAGFLKNIVKFNEIDLNVLKCNCSDKQECKCSKSKAFLSL